MLSKGDDYPIHQRPEPVAIAGTDRNFYDRYFFSGYVAEDGAHYFAAALGVYPHLNIMDASFSLIHEGVQHNLHASREMHMERMDTHAGPIRVDVIEPLQTLRVRVEENAYGISADLTFRGRTGALEEPRFTHRVGPRTLYDYTRLTQNGTFEGWIAIEGQRIEVSADRFVGTRDRSWGTRPIGAQDLQPVLPSAVPQFYWLWAPLNFADRVTFFALNDDAEGKPWHRSAAMASVGAAQPERMASVESAVTYRKGTRRVETLALDFHRQDGEHFEILVEPQFNFYMSGLGYMHPEWGHGVYKGPDEVGYETYDLSDIDDNAMANMHIQAFCKARMTSNGKVIEGSGKLEQLVFGPHKPSGFKDILDGAT